MKFKATIKIILQTILRAHSLVVSDLCSEIKGFRLSPTDIYVQSWVLCSSYPANVYVSVRRVEVVVRS